MANANIHSFLRDLGSTSDDRALGLIVHDSVLEAFPKATRFLEHMWTRPYSGGKSVQFPAAWRMSDAVEYTKGTELSGNEEPINEERLIPLDNKPIQQHAWVSFVDEAVAHFDERVIQARESAYAVARTLDSRAARMIALGARQAARGPASEFPAGNDTISRAGATVAEAYPRSTQGSYNLQADIADAVLYWEQNDVPDDGSRCIFLSPYLRDVLRQDRTLQSRDYVDANGNILEREIMTVEGCKVVTSTVMPFAGVGTSTSAGSNVTTGEAAYQGDFTLTSWVGIGHMTAVGHITHNGIQPIGPKTDETRLNSTLIGAFYLGGMKWLRPEACVEAKITGS